MGLDREREEERNSVLTMVSIKGWTKRYTANPKSPNKGKTHQRVKSDLIKKQTKTMDINAARIYCSYKEYTCADVFILSC